MVPVKAIDDRRMRSNFSAHAAEYDRYAAVQKRVVEHLVSRLFAVGPLNGPLLDIGTGTGALATALGGDCPGGMVLMDIAHGMTRAASRRLPATMPCDGDARHLPFARGSFQTVVSSSVYQWVECLPSAFSEVTRVLQPGGSFAIALFGERTLFELRDSHRKALASCQSDRSSHVQSFPSATEVADALKSAGLVCQNVCSVPEVDYHADVPDLLRQLKHIGASNASAARPKGLASRRVMQQMIASYEQDYRCGEGLPATYEVLLGVATKPFS
jgi:malonyl-CoA O-methyltransferase